MHQHRICVYLACLLNYSRTPTLADTKPTLNALTPFFTPPPLSDALYMQKIVELLLTPPWSKTNTETCVSCGSHPVVCLRKSIAWATNRPVFITLIFERKTARIECPWHWYKWWHYLSRWATYCLFLFCTYLVTMFYCLVMGSQLPHSCGR